MKEIRYELIAEKILGNTILHVGNIVRTLDMNLGEFAEFVGYNQSTISRNKTNLIKNGYKKENEQYAINILFGIDTMLLFRECSFQQIRVVEKFIYEGIFEDVDKKDSVFQSDVSNFMDQSWICTDWQNGKGFMYELAYLRHEAYNNQFRDKHIEMKDYTSQLIQTANIAFTCSALMEYQNHMDRIVKVLKEAFEVSECKLHASNIVRNEIYYGRIERNIGKEFLFTQPLKESMYMNEEYSDFVNDILEIYSAFESSDNKILLFVRGKREVEEIECFFSEILTSHFIFIYSMGDYDEFYVRFNGFSYSYPASALMIYNKLKKPSDE